jgi:hypothetical protein
LVEHVYKEIDMKKLSLILALLLVVLWSPVQAGVGIYGFVGLTGGSSSSLDGQSCVGLLTNDIALGIDANGYFYLYYYNSTASAAELYPGVIKPDDITSCGANGYGRWLLNPRTYSDSFYSNADDGEHIANFSNSGQFTGTPSDGAMTTRRDREITSIYSGDDTEWVPFFVNKVKNYTASQSPLSYRLHYGGLITNDGAIATLTHVLQPAEKDMYICFSIGEGNQNVHIDPNASNTILPVCNSDGDKLQMDGTLGQSVCMRSTARDGGYDWQIVSLYPPDDTRNSALTDGN